MAIQNWSLLMITSGGISGNSHFLGLPENEEPQFQWIIIIFPPKMTTFGDLLSITEASDGSLRSASFLSETQCGMSQAWASRLLGSLVFNPICWRIRYLHPFLLTIFFSKRHIFPASCDPEGMENHPPWMSEKWFPPSPLVHHYESLSILNGHKWRVYQIFRHTQKSYCVYNIYI